MKLDDETRGLLGFAGNDTAHENEFELRDQAIATRNERDVGFSDRIDGRHRARDRAALSLAYWERRRAKNHNATPTQEQNK